MQMIKPNLTMKVVVGLSIVLGALAGITAFSIKSIFEAQEHVSRVAGDINTRLMALETQGDLIRDIQIRVRNIVLLDDPKLMRDELNKLQAVRNIYDNSESRLTQLFGAGTDQSLVSELVQLRAAARPKTDQAIKLGLENRNSDATKILLEDVTPNIEKRLGILNQLVEEQQKSAEKATMAAAAAHDRATVLTVSMGIFAIVLSLSVGGVVFLLVRGLESAASVPGRDME